MKLTATAGLAFIMVAGCTINRQDVVTSWGKSDVSMLDYRTDAGQCAVFAATTEAGPVAGKTAGGISGQNTGPAAQHATGGSSAAPGNSGSAGNGLPTLTGSTYRDSAPGDFVNRAAMEDRTQEIFEQRARMDMLRSCLEARGYTEFQLTGEQRSRVSRMQRGSAERREYLYTLGTNPAVLREQAVPRTQ